MTDPFVCIVVDVDKQRFPVARKGIVIDSISVVLGSNVRPGCSHLNNRLVVAAVTILQFICIGSGGKPISWFPRQIPKTGLSS